MKTSLCILGSALAVSGCAELAALVPVSDAVTLPGGATYTAEATYLIRDRNGNTVTMGSETPLEITLVKTDSGEKEATMTFNGNTVTFTEADIIAAGYEFEKTLSDGTTMYMWNPAGSLQDLFDGNGPTKYVAAVGASDFNANVNNRIYSVLGSPTTTTPTSGTADYTGDLFGEIYLANNSESRTQWTGDVALSADFGAASPTIGGRISNIAFDNTPDPDDMIIKNTTIGADATYQTTLGLDCTGCGSIDSSSVNGAFYGPDGVETGGTVRFTGQSSAAQPVVGQGAFTASQ